MTRRYCVASIARWPWKTDAWRPAKRSAMFDTRWRKTLRDAWGHRARTLLVVLAVALGLIGAGAILDAWALVRVTTQASYVASHPVAATLRITPLDEAFLARIRMLPGVAAARLRR